MVNKNNSAGNRIKIYKDGVRQTTDVIKEYTGTPSTYNGDLQRFGVQLMNASRSIGGVVDNLRSYDYEVTDFTNRFDERARLDNGVS